MSALYIKLEDGTPVGYPMLADNIRGLLKTSTMTPDLAKEHGYYPFENVVVPDTDMVLSNDGFELCDDGVVRPKLTLRELTDEEKRDRFIRPLRDRYLFLSDWTQTLDAPLTSAKQAEWAAYRQALRDLPSQFPDAIVPEDVIWPEPPAK